MKPRNKMYFLTIFAVICILPFSEEYGTGAPPPACVTMLPKHSNIQPQASSPPYVVKTSATQVRQGSGIDVTISSPLNVAVVGYLMQARSVQQPDVIVGNWSNLPAKSKFTQCSNAADSVTHSNTETKQDLVFRWNAPRSFLGSVIFRATVAEDYSKFWQKIDSTLVEVVASDTADIPNRPPLPDNSNPISPPIYPLERPTDAPVKSNDPFYTGCGSNKLCFGSSPSCLQEQNCKAAVSVLVEGEVYTFELLGNDGPKYVSVGLSTDKNMGDDSSMDCVQINGRISAHTSWTYPKSAPYVSRDNVPQNIVRLISSSYENGRLYCRFTRDARSTVRDVEFDLVKDTYHLLLVAGSDLEGTNLKYHDVVRTSSEEKLSLSETGEVAGASKLLLKLHGAFMLVAWIGTSSCGILLARYFRQTWLGKQLGGKDLWFAWHRIFMVLTWLLTMAAFIIILVFVGGWTGTGDNPHAIIGIVTIVLCFIQPIGAFFRPHPNTSKRPIFNWAHWFLGNSAHILGIVTIFFAVSLNKAELPEWMAYILAGFVAFHVIMHIVLSIAACVSDGRITNGRVNSFPMKDLVTNTRQAMNQDRKADAPHSGFRKLFLGIYFVINILFVVVLVCLVALAPINETLKSVSNVISGSMGNN